MGDGVGGERKRNGRAAHEDKAWLLQEEKGSGKGREFAPQNHDSKLLARQTYVPKVD